MMVWPLTINDEFPTSPPSANRKVKYKIQEKTLLEIQPIRKNVIFIAIKD